MTRLWQYSFRKLCAWLGNITAPVQSTAGAGIGAVAEHFVDEIMNKTLNHSF